jgi:hypothetical protein
MRSALDWYRAAFRFRAAGQIRAVPEDSKQQCHLFKKWGKMGCLQAAKPPANTPPPIY